ncbi:MAG: hypothetical protein H6P98_607 [Candidatus Aminicenantes bacterium]|nr:hypothetical protein [Candidatus Aminicenantes bacterium]
MKRIFWWAGLVILAASLAYAQENEILKLKEKILEIQNKGELGFRNFALCSTIIGFGSYVPLPSSAVDTSGQLLVYYEPVNVFTARKEGLYEIWYTQDMVLLDEKGETLQEWPNALDFHYTTRTPVMDLFAQNSLDLAGQVPAGKYKFKAVLKDKLSGRTAVRIMDFEIR